MQLLQWCCIYQALLFISLDSDDTAMLRAGLQWGAIVGTWIPQWCSTLEALMLISFGAEDIIILGVGL